MAVNKVIYGGNTLVDLTGDTVTAADLADGAKATGADGNPIVGIMQKVTIDAELSTTSTNPVQNRVIKEALDGKLGKNETAARATQDGAGNNIVDTYAKKTDISGFVKTVNGTAPDTNGNVAINVSGGGGGGVSTSEVNTWTAEQIFNDVTIGVDAGKLNIISNSTAMPTTSYTFVAFDGSLLTLDFSALSTQASGDTPKTIKFKIVIISWANIPTLKIINAGTSVIVPENTKLGGLINLLDGMMIFDGNQIITIFHVTNMSHDGGNIS